MDLAAKDKRCARFDADFRVEVREDGTVVPGGWAVLIRGHWHRGESPGEIRRGVESDLNEELRRLTGED